MTSILPTFTENMLPGTEISGTPSFVSPATALIAAGMSDKADQDTLSTLRAAADQQEIERIGVTTDGPKPTQFTM